MNQTIASLDPLRCTGCSVCEKVCPVHAIAMKENKEGFFYPVLNHNDCIQCGKCAKQCHLLSPLKEATEQVKESVYAAVANSNALLMQSSSGGMFSILAEHVLSKAGVVFGCAYDENLHVQHIAIQTEQDLCKLRGSKYVESDLKNTFYEAKQFLEDGRYVLFSGCPCHISALQKYLGKAYPNLLLVDIVCHGVPSRKLFRKYLGWLRYRGGSSVAVINFRDKAKGWGKNASVKFKNGKWYRCHYGNDPYYASFQNKEACRESCYQCVYATQKRWSDITLADYWGVEVAHPELATNKGVSVLILNTTKAIELFGTISSQMHVSVSSYRKASAKNGNLKQHSKRPAVRDKIYQHIDELPDVDFIKENFKLSWKYVLKNQLKNAMPFQLKAVIKRVCNGIIKE